MFVESSPSLRLNSSYPHFERYVLHWIGLNNDHHLNHPFFCLSVIIRNDYLHAKIIRVKQTNTWIFSIQPSLFVLGSSSRSCHCNIRSTTNARGPWSNVGLWKFPPPNQLILLSRWHVPQHLHWCCDFFPPLFLFRYFIHFLWIELVRLRYCTYLSQERHIHQYSLCTVSNMCVWLSEVSGCTCTIVWMLGLKFLKRVLFYHPIFQEPVLAWSITEVY